MTKQFSRRNFIKTGVAGALSAAALSDVSSASTLAAETKTSVANTQGTKPAILGGEQAHQTGWPAWPAWEPKWDSEIMEVLDRRVWSRSKLVTEFEEQWAEKIGTQFCLAVVNGTNALSASFMELNIGPGDEVIAAPYTFSASIFGILYQKAMPVFADIDPTTYQIDPEQIKAKITPRTKAILPVHICGLPSDMENIMKIAKEHHLYVIEDCCQAHLSTIHGKPVGSFGDAGCFSFQTSKVLPIGEGGAITTNDQAFKERLYSYHNYGYATTVAPGTYAGSIHSFRLANKIRMAEYQAAIGLCQLRTLEQQIAVRNENGSYLRKRIAEIPGLRPVRYYDGVDRVSYYMCPFIYNPDEFKGLSRDKFVMALRAEGVNASNGYPNDPLYSQGIFKETLASEIYQKIYSKDQLNFDEFKERNSCPNLIKTFETSVWLDSAGMFLGSKSDMDDIVNAVIKIRDNAEAIKKAG
ncbi:MAG: DegT/DnrJ/EryC1/StrS family aminotransferase [Planctomycetia bacterium]|nr:DegT/DnrJ/EryC1/StrS family aminotransferase [Planctomycetia bacterium]